MPPLTEETWPGKVWEWEEQEHSAESPEGQQNLRKRRKKLGSCSSSPLQAARGIAELTGRRGCSDSKVPAAESR